MGLDMWFREDQQRILASLAQAAGRYSGEFQEGYMAALHDLAVAYGLARPTHAKPTTEPGGSRRQTIESDGWR